MDKLTLISAGDEIEATLEFTAEVVEKIETLEKHCWSWDTNKEFYHRATWASDDRVETVEEVIGEWDDLDLTEASREQ